MRGSRRLIRRKRCVCITIPYSTHILTTYYTHSIYIHTI
nr:MAG TPA: hypothetical protein [Caudoviricetes sp.]